MSLEYLEESNHKNYQGEDSDYVVFDSRKEVWIVSHKTHTPVTFKDSEQGCDSVYMG